MLAGFLEVIVFHPFDTVSKRLMSHESRVVQGGLTETLGRVRGVITKGQQDTGVAGTIRHLYRGTQYAMYYKVSQRLIKFAGQPVVKDYFHANHIDSFRRVFGDKKGKQMMEATAGSLVGVSEVCILPFDRMKVLSQTNKEAIGQRGMFSVMRQEGIRKMYAGAGTTAVRNAPGSFLLFGGTAFTKDFVFGLEDYRKATFFQNLVSSSVGACLGVFFTSPMDVIKTRIQNKNFTQASSSGISIFVQVVKTEGFSAFFKGITPKVIATSPKLVFTYTLTEYFAGMFTRAFGH